MTTSSSLWNLRTWPDECLHQKCTVSHGRVPDGLIEEMESVVKTYEAYGLACSQLGVTDCRIFVMRDWENPKGKVLVFENPVIVEHSKETYVDTEGCLSFPGQNVRVVRSRRISIEFDVQFGYDLPAGDDRITWEFEGINARIAQHEIDHLDGIMIFDHINSNIIQKTTLEKYFRNRRKHARIEACQIGRSMH